ncbi:MAG: cephalosporin hydroxylase family protein [Chlamydiales bacterium]
MKWEVNENRFIVEGKELPLYSAEAFSILSKLWLKVGWTHRHHYSYTWMGLPILQLPEDLLRIQELVFQLKPDVIIETGIAMGGSLLFYASLCKALDNGRVIGIDIDLRPHSRARLEQHALAPWITLLEGDSATLRPSVEGKVLVILDANHSKKHVAKELENFAPLVTPGSYLLVADGIKEELADTPRGKAHWKEDNPRAAILEFLERHPEFVLDSPQPLYSKNRTHENISHFSGGWLKKMAVS